jgi:hypothetical protein
MRMLLAQSLIEYGALVARESGSGSPRVLDSLTNFIESVPPAGWLAAGAILLVSLKLFARAR